ncbi:unnamed protein product [Mycena citricolor]|uniref:Chromo domain-containing protein n=1 Tax=Mycena citricolor TaxID=2018698 RepID=A0AAD2HC25_9AGAR|nr:unnamed protein product [Mycena citricolor]CAK5272772.1 unnamed protein product [Mycena citricolor]
MERWLRKQYLVKWKGWPHSKNTWEPSRHLIHAKKVLRDWQRKQSNPDTHIRLLPMLKARHWDYLIHCYKFKDERLSYPQQQLFDPYENVFTPIGPVDEDINPREGVMS